MTATEADRPRLLFHGCSPWTPTGYGQQISLFAPKLNEHYNVAMSSTYGLEGARLRWEGMTVFPGLAGADWGNKSLVPHARTHFGGDPADGIVLTLLDVFVLNPQMFHGLRGACWVPVDHEPVPPRVAEFFELSGAIPIAMSRFGQRMLHQFDPLYVPHAINLDDFSPIDRKEAREQARLPQDKFIVGMVAANKGNPSRKCFAEALSAFRTFHRMQPDSILFLHSEVTGEFQGVDLAELIRALGLPDGSVFVADQRRLMFDPLPPRAMAHFYSAFDVLLSPSAGEGFGIPVLEAQACGTPAIVTDFSAQIEVCGSGWRVDHFPYWTPQESWQAHPKVDDIVDALKAAYRLGDRGREQYAAKARKHAEQYGVDRVMEEHMLPALAEVEARYAAREPKALKAAA